MMKGARCDFEQGWCGWNNTLRDDLDWTRHNGSTPTTPTVTGTGSTTQLAMEMLDRAAGMDIVHIPYNGNGPAGAAAPEGRRPSNTSPIVSRPIWD